MSKTRLDLLLVERGLAESRARAQALIMAGQVRLSGQVELSASRAVDVEAEIELEGLPRFVSRGGDKLEAALEAFPVRVEGRVCVDVGASTGGFTDCLLQHGAGRVYSVDVGRGQLHWKLRTDPRVVVMEATNARFLERLPEAVELVTIDASFISLRVLLPAVRQWGSRVEVVALVKPQFEAGRQQAARHKGVIRDPLVHRQVLQEVLEFARQEGFFVLGLVRSPVLGPKGNVEFLAWLGPERESAVDLAALVRSVLG